MPRSGSTSSIENTEAHNSATSEGATTSSGSSSFLPKPQNYWTDYINTQRYGSASTGTGTTENEFINYPGTKKPESDRKEKTDMVVNQQEVFLQRIKDPIERAKVRKLIQQAKIDEIEFLERLDDIVKELAIAKVQQVSWVEHTKRQSMNKDLEQSVSPGGWTTFIKDQRESARSFGLAAPAA